MICNHCEKPLPWGCCNVYDDHEQCPLTKRKDIAWQVGRALWSDLKDRRGIKQELEQCNYTEAVEIIETLGNIAITSIAKAVIEMNK